MEMRNAGVTGGDTPMAEEAGAGVRASPAKDSPMRGNQMMRIAIRENAKKFREGQY